MCIHLYIYACFVLGLVLFTHVLFVSVHNVWCVCRKACRHAVTLSATCRVYVTPRFFYAVFQGCKFMLVYACITCNFYHTHANVKNSKTLTCKLLVGLYFYVCDRYCVIQTAISVLALWRSDCSYISSTQSFIHSQNHLHIHILMKRVERDRKAFNHWATCHVTAHLTLIAPFTWML